MRKPEPWTILSTRTLYEDRWVRLRGDTCRTVGDHVLRDYHVLDYPDWSTIVALDGDHVILVRQFRHGAGAMSMELPGGVVDAADTDPAQAAARELLEETGYQAGPIRLIASLSPNGATHANRIHVSLAEGVRRVGPQSLDGSEAIEILRVPVGEAVRLALSGGMLQSMHVGLLMIGLHAAGRLGGVSG